MPLTDTAIRKSKPAERPIKLSDSAGLYLLVNPSGSRWWRFDYRLAGKRKTLSMGTYPDTGLAEARERRDGARRLLAAGIDPGEQRKAAKAAGLAHAANSFAVVAEEWLAKQSARMAPATLEKARWTFDDLVFPWIGSRPISEIDPPEMLSLLRRIEDRGAHETAHRTKQRCGQVFRYAIATHRAVRDPTADLRGALTPVKTVHRPALTSPALVGELLRAIDGYTGGIVARSALKLAPLVFARPGELRQAEWSEIDMDAALWRIPKGKMKMREEHTIPLSTQAIAVLSDLRPLTGNGQYVFPSERSRQRPMSDGTVNAALRRLAPTKTP